MKIRNARKIRFVSRTTGLLVASLLSFFFAIDEGSPFQLRHPFLRFENHPDNPILLPERNDWESKAVFNPAAIVKDTTVYLFYRAEDRSGEGIWNGTSRIGLATSDDGIYFSRQPEPVLAPTLDYETPGGCEDPRVIEIGGTYYMTYTAFDGHTPRLALATSKDLRQWTKRGLVFPDSGMTRAGVILPQKVNGRYVMYFSDGEIRIAYSDDLFHWQAQPDTVMATRAGKFDSQTVEPGAALILGRSILLLYNGVNDNLESAPGQAIFSLDDPTQLQARSEGPSLEPPSLGLSYGAGRSGICLGGLVNFKGQYFLYYGLHSSVVALAVGQPPAANN